MNQGRMLIDVLEDIQDPRLSRRRQHKLVDILVLTFCGVFSRCQSWYEIAEFADSREDFFRTFLELPNGIPSHDTFNRVFQLLEFEQISRVLFEWLQEFHQVPNEQHSLLHIDGKFLTGSNKKNGDSRSTLGMISAYASETGLCLMSVMTRTEKDQGEKKSMEKLIEGMNLKKSIVTIDAAGATPTIVQKIVDRKGDYLIGLKANQKSFLQLCEDQFLRIPVVDSFTTDEKSHGRHDVRTYEQLSIHNKASASFEKCLRNQIAKWPHLETLVKVTSTRAVGQNPSSTSVRYYFSSLKKEIREVAYAIRSHWKVENSLHWVLDVHFKEDHCRTRTGYADANLALLRRLAISVLKKDNPKKKSVSRLMFGCLISNETLLKALHSSAF